VMMANDCNHGFPSPCTSGDGMPPSPPSALM